MASPDLPNIAASLAPVLERVLPEHRPLLIALAERMAAERYRSWAAAAEQPSARSDLLACAAREEEIAERVEALYPEAAGIQADLVAKHPGLEDLARSIFGDRPLHEQYAIQAEGERVGAATWRALAKHAEPAARRAFLDCAELEELSAEVLETLLSDRG